MYHTVISIDDPELDDQMARLRQNPGAVSLRIVPTPENGGVDRLARGEFEPFFAAAEQHQVPAFRFSDTEKEWLLGGSLRKALRWVK